MSEKRLTPGAPDEWRKEFSAMVHEMGYQELSLEDTYMLLSMFYDEIL